MRRTPLSHGLPNTGSRSMSLDFPRFRRIPVTPTRGDKRPLFVEFAQRRAQVCASNLACWSQAMQARRGCKADRRSRGIGKILEGRWRVGVHPRLGLDVERHDSAHGSHRGRFWVASVRPVVRRRTWRIPTSPAEGEPEVGASARSRSWCGTIASSRVAFGSARYLEHRGVGACSRLSVGI